MCLYPQSTLAHSFLVPFVFLSLSQVTPTNETFFQHVASVNSTVQTMASLLFGFDSNVAAAASPQPASSGVSPLDASLARAFETHVPVAFRTQYAKAISTIVERYPRSARVAPPTATPVPATAVSAAASSPSVKIEVGTQATAACSSSSASVKRPHSDGSSDADLPPLSTQQSFVAHVKAKLSEPNYEQFKRVILALEAAPTPPAGQSCPPQLLQMFQQLQRVLDRFVDQNKRFQTRASATSSKLGHFSLALSPSFSSPLSSLVLLRAYARLIPSRLRASYSTWLSSMAAVSSLKWTDKAELIDDDDDDHSSRTSAAGSASKRAKFASDPRMPVYEHKMIVRKL